MIYWIALLMSIIFVRKALIYGLIGGVVNLYVEEVDALHKELKDKGVKIDLETIDQSFH